MVISDRPLVNQTPTKGYFGRPPVFNFGFPQLFICALRTSGRPIEHFLDPWLWREVSLTYPGSFYEIVRGCVKVFPRVFLFISFLFVDAHAVTIHKYPRVDLVALPSIPDTEHDNM